MLWNYSGGRGGLLARLLNEQIVTIAKTKTGKSFGHGMPSTAGTRIFLIGKEMVSRIMWGLWNGTKEGLSIPWKKTPMTL